MDGRMYRCVDRFDINIEFYRATRWWITTHMNYNHVFWQKVWSLKLSPSAYSHRVEFFLLKMNIGWYFLYHCFMSIALDMILVYLIQVKYFSITKVHSKNKKCLDPLMYNKRNPNQIEKCVTSHKQVNIF